jgi:hypothetical protein
MLASTRSPAYEAESESSAHPNARRSVLGASSNRAATCAKETDWMTTATYRGSTCQCRPWLIPQLQVKMLSATWAEVTLHSNQQRRDRGHGDANAQDLGRPLRDRFELTHDDDETGKR